MESPKKSLGQHWLHDPASLQAMVRATNITAKDTILEIGPGLGTLTTLLTQTAAHVIAVEFDEQLAAALPARVPAANLEVVNQDILRFDPTRLPPGYKIVANIPYYLTSNLLRVLCESANPFDQAALLVQKEVAQRVCAKPGEMSLLAVSVQFYCQAELGRVVEAALFTPPPKVDSQILKLTRRAQPLFTDVPPSSFFRVVKAGFSQRRKTILNSLSAGLRLDRAQTTTLLEKAGITTHTRAQELSMEHWHTLARLTR